MLKSIRSSSAHIHSPGSSGSRRFNGSVPVRELGRDVIAASHFHVSKILETSK
jgi:hypothetical protein